MKSFSRLKSAFSGLTLGVAVVAFAASATVSAAPAQSATPPSSTAASVQAKPAVAPGTKDAKQTKPLGSTAQIQTDASGKPIGAQKRANIARVGSVSGVDFSTFYNYCWKNLLYTTVVNTTSSTQYIHVQVYNQGAYHDVYATLSAGTSYSYPAFYGTDGSYSAYLYVWNGSSYQYDEYKGGTNTCNVSVTRTYNTGGWVQLKIQNTGTAYATQISTELAPYPGSGTYTGTQYDYPAAGGAAIYRWFSVGTSPYGIVSQTYGSFNYPAMFSGDL
jgi:hypothetical protein